MSSEFCPNHRREEVLYMFYCSHCNSNQKWAWQNFKLSLCSEYKVNYRAINSAARSTLMRQVCKCTQEGYLKCSNADLHLSKTCGLGQERTPWGIINLRLLAALRSICLQYEDILLSILNMQ